MTDYILDDRGEIGGFKVKPCGECSGLPKSDIAVGKFVQSLGSRIDVIQWNLFFRCRCRKCKRVIVFEKEGFNGEESQKEGKD